MPRLHRPGRDTPLGNQLLAEHLRSDAAAREASVARFNSGICGFFFVSVLGLWSSLGEARALCVMALCAIYSGYYGWLARVLKRGWFHPAICWFNVCLETSAVAWLFLFDILFADAEQALSNPSAVLWSAIVVLAALRSNRRLALFAGFLVGAEMLLLYFFVALPRMAEPVPLMFTPPLMLQRAIYYCTTGVLAALMARHVMRGAEAALHAIRAKDLLGKYFLHERLGVGGMAEVFRATYSPEGGFEKVVAIKRILPAYVEDEDFVMLFRREAELGSLLNHPNIVQVLDVGRFGDTYFMAMEHIEGLSLRELLKSQGPLPPAVVAYIGAELGGALDYVHRRTSSDGVPLNLVHRDVNPPNILLSRIGEVKLGDFGVARAAIHVRLTRVDRVRGKLGYMAPEQVRGESFDGRADLFALGLTLHEALTGQRVFQREDASDTVRKEPPSFLVPPSVVRPEVPPAVDAAVMGLLRWPVVERTPRGQVLREQLCGLAGELAPYPHGQRELARLVQAALARQDRTPVRSSELETRTAHVSVRASSEEPTAVLSGPGAAASGQQGSPDGERREE
ncbi:serine/threonine-protein kinase [Vitiosangium sp. GDMCC 1.1324]|uniref:serine/threonine-protein kinase n=1 Tax=Vitiosangium sp. (strain GDMCC 1.1324) TaxID=2138576 RepID=UPI000D3853D0|nr:serine/threonine-protein kinase [Vitiosangium sp. GDMCC 1.1324]PTL83862.1 serine/threonine protein kinase [Vitiosangium sp. GDMCC 1.1324]